MKKLFLLACVASASVAGYAQVSAVNVAKAEKVSMLSMGAKAPAALEMGGKSASRIQKSVANNLYYYRPEGSLFCGLDEEGSGYKATIAAFAPYTDIVFENMSKNPTQTQWTINGNDLSDAVKDGNLNYGQFSKQYIGNTYYAPTISYGSDKFTFGEWNSNGAAIGAFPYGAFSPVDHNAKTYGWGSLADGFLFGSGTITTKAGDVDKSVAIETQYEKPMSPFYIENVHAIAVGVDKTPLADNVTLTLAFYEVLDEKNGTTAEQPFGVMTATSKDLTLLTEEPSSSQYSSTGNAYFYDITFSAKSQDEFGEVAEPVVVDKPYVIAITGFDQDGVRIGFQGVEQPSGDRPYLGVTSLICLRNTDDKYYSHYYTNTQIALSYTGCFDHVETLDVAYDQSGNEYPNFNQLKVSDDGATVSNVGSASTNYAILETAFDWKDAETGEENYYTTEETPSWIEALNTEEQTDGTVYVSVKCSALPNGVKGRGTKIYFSGKGYTSTTPLYVLQGDYTKEQVDAVTGISVVESNNAKNTNSNIFNLAGQQVGKDYKGIVVKDGKKFIRK